MSTLTLALPLHDYGLDWLTQRRPLRVRCTGAALPSRHFATGGFHGHLQTWDLERLEQPVYDTVAHQGIVNGIDGFGGQVAVLDHGRAARVPRA